MAERGESFFNPVTRTRMVFVDLPKDNGGRQIAIDWFVAPGERLAAARHYHAGPDGLVVERFNLLDGSAECTVGAVRRRAKAPHAFEVPCNTVHVHPANTGGGTLHVRQTVFLPEPDMSTLTRIEQFFETLMALSQQGRANRNGDIKNPLQAALTLHATLLDPTYLPVIPRGAQLAAFSGIAKLARLLRYRAHMIPVREGDAEAVYDGRKQT